MANNLSRYILVVLVLNFFVFTVNLVYAQDQMYKKRIYPAPNERSRSYILEDKVPTQDTKTWLEKPNFDIENIKIYTEKELKDTSNMTNWSYREFNNDYYNENAKLLSDLGYSKSEIKSYKFKSFPIKYYIIPSNSFRNMVIRKALQEMSFYFSMKEVDLSKEADLTIEVIKADELKAKCSKASVEAFGCGFNSSKDGGKAAYAGIVKSAFKETNIKGVVLHFLGRAFGIAVESSNPMDLMSKIEIKNKSQKSLNEDENEDENSFSERDLNTLYRIYNNP